MDPTTAQLVDHGSLLKEACDRNQQLEIHYTCAKSGGIISLRARVLGIHDNLLCLDKPQRIGQKAHLRQGQKIEAYVILRGNIYSFRSTVVQTDCTVRLNNYMTVHGIRITKPKSLATSQRRSDYRVTMAAMAAVAVDVHPSAPSNKAAAPRDAARRQGRMVNLSLRGCAVVFDERTPPAELKVGALIYTGFTLPDDPHDYVFLAEVRAVMPIMNHQAVPQAVRIGMHFLTWPNTTYLRRQVQPLGRFIARRQREVMSRQHGERA